MKAVHRCWFSAALAVVAAASLVAYVVPARATSMVQLSTRDLSLQSSDIVIGKVESVRSYWNPAHTRILTDVGVSVSQTFAGETAQHLTLTELGGEVDGIRVTVPGCPAFRPGEEALFFVWRDRKGDAQVNGLAQGKFDIERDPRTGAAFVQRATPGFAVRDVRTLSLVPRGQATPRLRLDDLVREIRVSLRDKASER